MDTNELYYNSIDLLKSMIRCPSHSREEAAVADILEAYFRTYSLTPLRKGNNVWVYSPEFDPIKPTILLNSHIDTVKPVAGWTLDPYEAKEVDGKIFGLGSNDAGGSLVSLLHAFLFLITKPQPYNLIFLASCEEEISGKEGIESVLPQLPSIAFGLVGEPTGMNPAIAEKGLMVLDCVVFGKSGHAAREEGENAIYKAMKSIEWFRIWDFPLKSSCLGSVKMNVTMVRSGTQHNVIPDRCEFTVDVRTNECYRNSDLFEEIKQACGCDEIKARSFRLNSSGISPDHPVVRRALLLNKMAFGSPTLSDQALMHFPSLKMGPGESSRSHTADEYIWIAEIREALDLYIRILDGLELKC